MTNEHWVGLAEAVGALRGELEAAADAAGDHPRFWFTVEPVELEFALEIRREATADGGVRFGVVTIGAKGGASSVSSHRLKLVLRPQDRESGGSARIRDREQG